MVISKEKTQVSHEEWVKWNSFCACFIRVVKNEDGCDGRQLKGRHGLGIVRSMVNCETTFDAMGRRQG